MGMTDSDNPTQLSDSTRGGGNKDTLGSGQGKREHAPASEAKASGDPSASLGEGATDASETLAGKRARAPVEGVMDSDTPIQAIDKRSRLGEHHLAFVMDKEVLREHVQRWQRAFEEKIESQTRSAPGASIFVDRGGPVLFARGAKERDLILGREFTEHEERTFSDLAKKAKAKGLEARGHLRIYSPIQPGSQQKELADARRVLTWKAVEGLKTVKARLVARGFQGPDRRMGHVDSAGSVSCRSSHLQVISLGP